MSELRSSEKEQSLQWRVATIEDAEEISSILRSTETSGLHGVEPCRARCARTVTTVPRCVRDTTRRLRLRRDLVLSFLPFSSRNSREELQGRFCRSSFSDKLQNRPSVPPHTSPYTQAKHICHLELVERSLTIPFSFPLLTIICPSMLRSSDIFAGFSLSPSNNYSSIHFTKENHLSCNI